jgi:hypothetical protein
LIHIDSFFYLFVDLDAIFQLIREHDLLNRLDANVLSIRKVVVVEIRDAVFQSIRFVNLDVVVKSIRELELHHHIIIFHFFRWDNIISLWERSTKQITDIKTNWSNFESLKTTSSSLFLKSKFDHSSQNFLDFHSFSIQRRTRNTTQLNRCLSLQQSSLSRRRSSHEYRIVIVNEKR